MNTLRRFASALLVGAVLLFTACSPKPDTTIVLWNQPSPALASLAHVAERPGLVRFNVLPTGSMEPFMTGGDYIVVDTTVPFTREALPDGCLCNYLPDQDKIKQFYPGLQPGVTVTHMLAAWSGDGCIMSGVANAHYEGGPIRMKKENYRGKVIAIYTTRTHP